MVVAPGESSSSSQSLVLALAKTLVGDYSNQQQAYDDPASFAHIRVFFRPLPYEFFGGLGLYSEQSYDYDLWSPYRQGIHRLVCVSNSVYVENYALLDPVLYAGAGHNPEILATIPSDSIARRHGCSMVFVPNDVGFCGSVEPGQACRIDRGGTQTYLVSEVELTATGLISWDRGMDVETHEHVWGSTHGPLVFTKRASFADEVPKLVAADNLSSQ